MDSSKKDILQELFKRYPELKKSDIEKAIVDAFRCLKETFETGGKLLICGNGGSAADADHITGELAKGFKLKRELTEDIKGKFGAEGQELTNHLQLGLPAINLASQCALISAIANDNGAEYVFAQQVMAYGTEKDCLLGISTSGNSLNIVNAFKTGRALGLKTIGMAGAKPGKIDELCDIVIKVPAEETFKIQEYHLPIYHAICAMLEETFFGQEL